MTLGFEQVLMQVVVNGTATELAGDAFVNSITSLMGSVTALIIAVSGIVVAIIASRSNGRTKTKQEEQAIGVAQAIQVAMQKLAENESRINAVGKATMGLATTDEQRKELDRDVAPIVNTSKERIDVIAAQTDAIKELIGVMTANTNVNNNKNMPRESEETLKVINDTLAKAKIG
jgi:hypothetical protein